MNENKQERPKWEPQPKQERILLLDASEKLFGGQRGGGKTDAGIVWLVEPKYIQHAKYRALILRKDAVDLSDWIDRAKFLYGSLGVEVVGNPAEFRFPSGAKFRLGHLKDKNSYEKYLGHEYQKILIEELTQIPDVQYYIEIMGSCRSSIKELKPRMFATTNPGGRGHAWVKSRFVDPAVPGQVFKGDDGRTRVFLPSSLEDNPALMENDPDYVKYLDGLQISNPDLYRAWRLGDWDVFKGQFFDNWRKDVHVIEAEYNLKSIPSNFQMRLAWDEGTTNPRSVHLMVQNNDGRIFVVWEYYKAGETSDVAAENIKQSLKDIGIYDKVVKNAIFIYDPSMDIKNNQTGVSTSTIVQNILGGIRKQPGNNSRIEGARKFRQYLNWSPFEEPLLQVWSTCRNLISTIPTLIYSENNPEDVDTDGEDHAYDSVRYGLMSFTSLPTRLAKDPQNALKKYKKAVKSAYKPMGGY